MPEYRTVDLSTLQPADTPNGHVANERGENMQSATSQQQQKRAGRSGGQMAEEKDGGGTSSHLYPVFLEISASELHLG